jgi:hypothetical protein
MKALSPVGSNAFAYAVYVKQGLSLLEIYLKRPSGNLNTVKPKDKETEIKIKYAGTKVNDQDVVFVKARAVEFMQQVDRLHVIDDPDKRLKDGEFLLEDILLQKSSFLEQIAERKKSTLAAESSRNARAARQKSAILTELTKSREESSKTNVISSKTKFKSKRASVKSIQTEPTETEPTDTEVLRFLMFEDGMVIHDSIIELVKAILYEARQEKLAKKTNSYYLKQKIADTRFWARDYPKTIGVMGLCTSPRGTDQPQPPRRTFDSKDRPINARPLVHHFLGPARRNKSYIDEAAAALLASYGKFCTQSPDEPNYVEAYVGKSDRAMRVLSFLEKVGFVEAPWDDDEANLSDRYRVYGKYV